jgi:8-oxo-dGTP pyrophosphatase MutT (NUDIX family)
VPHPPHARGRGRLQRARQAGHAGLSATDLAATLGRGLLSPAEALDIAVHGKTQSAVLVPLFQRDGQLHALFTKRRDDLKRHPGEISFPGGRRDPEDPDLLTTALRECEEEIGLDRARVTLAGALPPTPTFVTNYAIYPFVGVVEEGPDWVAQETEVAQILELAVDDVRDGYGRRRLVRRGVPFLTDTYQVGDHLIWGATGRIVSDLLRRLTP